MRVLTELYEPDAYFGRLEDLYLEARLDFSRGANRYWRRHPWHWRGPRGCSWPRPSACWPG